MNCTTIQTPCAATGSAKNQPGAETVCGRTGWTTFGRVIALVGQQLFHYRLVRAELIEQALEESERRREDDA